MIRALMSRGLKVGVWSVRSRLVHRVSVLLAEWRSLDPRCEGFDFAYATVWLLEVLRLSRVGG